MTRVVHTCHADGCTKPVPRKMFMCRTHWFMLDQKLRAEIWFHYEPGQENRMDPTAEYLDVAQRAIAYVRAKESK